jgi:ribonuclease PH
MAETTRTDALGSRGGARGGERGDAELRPVELQLDYTDNPLGSVLCSMGRTRVLCTVTEEPSVPRWLRGSQEGWITAEYSMLPGSTDTRVEREASRGRLSGRTQEIQRLIGRSLRAVADLSALGERTLWIDCDVLQADGGTRTASITGAYTALALACRKLVARGDVSGNPLRDAVAAVSVGMVDGRQMLDLCYEEDARADVDMNVVATGAGRLIEVQGTGEGATFSVEELHGLTDLALGGIARLIQSQREALSG